MSYKHWPILLKSLSLPVALGVLTLFIAFFVSGRMKELDDAYSDVIAKPEVATLANSRANRAITTFTLDAYRLATAIDDKTVKSANAAIAADRSKLDEQLDTAMKVDAGHTDEYKDLKAQAHAAMDETCASAISIGQSTDPASVAKATAEMTANCEPALSRSAKSITEFNVKLVADMNKTSDTLTEKTNSTRMMMVTIIIIGLVTVLAFGIWITIASVVSPIKALVSSMEQMAKGNLALTIPGQDRKDEIGQMAMTTEGFRKSLEQSEQIRKEGEALKLKAEQGRRQGMLDLASDFEASVGGIVGLVSSAATQMQAAASQLSATAQEASAQSMVVSAAAEEAGTNVTSVASAAEELGASVAEIGRQVETSTSIALSAVNEANTVGQIVSELNETATSIGSVIDLIAGLASQTNLLALNATIESARAGEAGKGFAVVASEVKALASQTARATTDISVKVSQIQEAASRAASAMRNITGTIQEISLSSNTIATAVDQQTAATKEIVQAVNQAAVGTQEVTSNMSGVAQAAEQTGEAAVQVQSSSTALVTQAERLHHEMDKFLATVRAA